LAISRDLGVVVSCGWSS